MHLSPSTVISEKSVISCWDLGLVFLCKNCTATLPEKVHHLFPSNPNLEIEILSSPFFEPKSQWAF